MNYKFAPDVSRPLALLSHCPAYKPTPIREISSADSFQLVVKDETDRMGLSAFKALGGIYAVAQFLLEEWFAEKQETLAADQLINPQIQSWANSKTFVCASAGNHGMAVAKGAQLFGAKSRVHLSTAVNESFARRLSALGAEVIRSGANYEASMELAKLDAEQNSAILLADSSWSDYLRMPSLVMEGYTVIAEELRTVFSAKQHWPTHVFLQAGVGGFAAALAYEIRNNWPQQAKIIVVEPEAAPCLRESVRQGEVVTVEGPISAMGRLDCKEPSLIAFEVLKNLADEFVLISEDDAERGKSFLLQNNIETTTSGAAGLAAALNHKNLGIDLSNQDTVLVIATERIAF